MKLFDGILALLALALLTVCIVKGRPFVDCLLPALLALSYCASGVLKAREHERQESTRCMLQADVSYAVQKAEDATYYARRGMVYSLCASALVLLLLYAVSNLLSKDG